MAKSKFNFFDSKNGRVSPELVALAFDKSLHKKYLSLITYFQENKIDYDTTEYKRFIKLCDNQVLEQGKELAILRYFISEKTHDWGEVGEQQIKASLCRLLLDISSEEELTYSHAAKFSEQIELEFKRQGLIGIEIEEANRRLASFKFMFLTKLFVDRPGTEITEVLKFLGSKLIFHYDIRRGKPVCLMGESETKQISPFTVHFISKERMRSPNFVMPNVALVKGKNIFIRNVSLWNIVYQKWKPVFDQDSYVQSKIKTDPYWNISQGIKEKALSLYGVNSPESFEKVKESFFKDMRETIIYHEIGHYVVIRQVMDVEEAAIGDGPSYMNDDFFEALHEIFADLCPKQEKLFGAIYNMVRVSKKDPLRATKLFYIYLSDVWFYDTEDVFMYTYSDLICMILVRYINKNGSIDFEKLEEDLTFVPNQDVPSSLLEKLLHIYSKGTQGIKSIVKSTQYKLLGELRSFDYVKSVRMSDVKKTSPHVDFTQYDYLSPFWVNVFSFTDKLSDNYGALTQYVKQFKTDSIRHVFELTAGEDIATFYHYDHRRYLKDKLYELGIKADADIDMSDDVVIENIGDF